MAGQDWGLIFDWDGVVVDSGPLHREAWELLAKECGKRLPDGHFKMGFGRKNPWILRNILGWSEDPGELDKLSRRKEELYRELVRRRGLRPLPGAVRFIKKMATKKVPLAVASSTERENLLLGLSLLGLEPFFQWTVAAEDVGEGKPHPECFLMAAGGLGLPPERCVVLEDAPAGIEAAKRAGMLVVALATSHPSEALQDADQVASSFEELGLRELEKLVRLG
jgi:HAD superfamily hydrolase (TIGR01509 family)